MTAVSVIDFSARWATGTDHDREVDHPSADAMPKRAPARPWRCVSRAPGRPTVCRTAMSCGS
jgi:hypothetical protein